MIAPPPKNNRWYWGDEADDGESDGRRLRVEVRIERFSARFQRFAFGLYFVGLLLFYLGLVRFIFWLVA